MSPARTGASSGRSSGAPADHALGAGQRDERLLEVDGAGVEGPREDRLLAQDRAEDDVTPLDQERVRVAHRLDDDLRGLREERLAAAEQPPVAHRAAHDPAQDVPAPLVRRQHAVGDEKRDGARVVGDDLVAEALRLERVGVVAEQFAHAGVDRREDVRVVVGRDALEDGGEALEADARVDALERQRHAADRPAAGRTP